MRPISDLTEAELIAWLVARGEPRYRAAQLRRHMARGASSFESLTDIPQELRRTLAAELRWSSVEPVAEAASADGETRKVLLRLADGKSIESVLMPHHGERNAVCISTQAGCAMGCAFCATGEMGLQRNLTAGEIVDQVRHWQAALSASGERVSHVVYMGMGEPLHNYEPTVASLRMLADRTLFGISPRRITVSTCGVVNRMDALAAEGLPINLAVSLHGPSDGVRGEIMPINRKWGVEELLAACARYVARTKRRITLEYVLLAGVNDAEPQATELAALVARHGRLADFHVNLIPVNAGPGGFRRPKAERMERFAAALEEAGLAATLRISKGQDILAGCGQLKVEQR